MTSLAVYLGLFLNALIAATLLPAWSEATLAVLLAQKAGDPWLLFLAATTGNVLGSCINWGLGRGIARFRDRRWFPFTDQQFEKSARFFGRFGRWSLLFAWLPIIGDPLTLVAGTFRVPFISFLLLVTVGKAARYGLILYGFY